MRASTAGPVGLDFFGARYYESGTGRWLSPDWSAKAEAVPYANIHDPQSLNLYDYVEGNPVTRFDADGHMGSLCGSFGLWCQYSLPPPPPAPPGSAPGVDRKAWNDSLRTYKPVANSSETTGEIAGRVNNETMGMHDKKGESVPLSEAKKRIAHSRLNADEKFGDKAQRRAGMMAPSYAEPSYSQALDVTVRAVEERNLGVDATNGAFQYNMRTDSQASQGGTFYGATVHTSDGPYSLPTQHDWIVTYGQQ